MKKASSSFLVLAILILICAFGAHAQVYQDQGRITERVQQTLRYQERLRLSDLLRLSYQEQSGVEIHALTVSAQGPLQTQLTLSQNGRVLASEVVRKQLREIRFTLPSRLTAEGLELSSQSEVYLESIVADVSYARRPVPQYPQQPVSGSMITLSVNQTIRGYAAIPLEQLVRQQSGLTLEGTQIERVVVQGQPSMYGRSASVQVELNQRLMGQPKYLTTAQAQTPIPLQTYEEVRSLSLIVNGEAFIGEVRIRVGQVRPRLPEYPAAQRIVVNREIQARYPLELSQLLSYEQRLVRSIKVQARSFRSAQADLSLISYSGLEGSFYVSSYGQQQVIMLRRPMAVSELRLQSSSSVYVESLEIEFEQYPRY